jgi:hypothetical protein
MSVDASIVFLPRFTTLVGATVFTTLPLDVSRYSGAQFQVWRGTPRTASSTPTFKFLLSLEESLDTETWVLGPATPTPIEVDASNDKFFSYSFRLRWFRLNIEIQGDDPIVTCWAEGLLRGGGGGVWSAPGPESVAQSTGNQHTIGASRSATAAMAPPQYSPREDPYSHVDPTGMADRQAQEQFRKLSSTSAGPR